MFVPLIFITLVTTAIAFDKRAVAGGIYDRVSQMVFEETQARWPGHEARISWNDQGVATVLVAKPNGFSELFGMGAAIATQRLFQLHLAREVAYGRFAATTYRPSGLSDAQYQALVSQMISSDATLVTFSDLSVAQLDVAALTVREQELYQAYIDGINAFIVNFPSPADKSPYLGAPSGIDDITTPFSTVDLFTIERASSTSVWVFISLFAQFEGLFSVFLPMAGNTTELNRFMGCHTRRATYSTMPLENANTDNAAQSTDDCGLFSDPTNPHHTILRQFFGLPAVASILSTNADTEFVLPQTIDAYQARAAEAIAALGELKQKLLAAREIWSSFLPTGSASSYIILTGNRTVDGAPLVMYHPHQDSISPNNQHNVIISDGAGTSVSMFVQVGWTLSNIRHMVSSPCFVTAFEYFPATMADISLELVNTTYGIRIQDNGVANDVRLRSNFISVYNGGQSYAFPIQTPELDGSGGDTQSGSLFQVLYVIPEDQTFNLPQLSVYLGWRHRYYQQATTKRDNNDDFIRFFDSQFYAGAWNRCPTNIDEIFYKWNGAYGSAAWFTGYADRYGRIQSLSSGAYPVRSPLSDPRLPMIGSASIFSWSGFLPYDQQPHDRYPARNYLIGTNNRFESDSTGGMSRIMYGVITATARSFSAEILVRKYAKHSLETSRALVASRFNGFASVVVPRIVARVTNNANDVDVALALQLLAAWNYTNYDDSVAATLWETMEFQMQYAMWENAFFAPGFLGVQSLFLSDRAWEVLLHAETGADSMWSGGGGSNQRTFYEFIETVLKRSIAAMRLQCSQPDLSDCGIGTLRPYLAKTRYAGMTDGRYDIVGGPYVPAYTGIEGAYLFSSPITINSMANQPVVDGPIHRRAATVRNDVLRLYSVMHPGNADCPSQICTDERTNDHADQVDILRTPGKYTFATQFGHARYPQSSLFSCSVNAPLASRRTIDRCGVCGGNNSTCGACVYSVSFWKTRNSERPSSQQRIEWPFNLEDRRTGGISWLGVVSIAAEDNAPLPTSEGGVWRRLAEQYIAASLNVVRGSISDAALGVANAANIYEAGVLVDLHVESGSMPLASIQRAQQLIVLLRSFNNGHAGVPSC